MPVLFVRDSVNHLNKVLEVDGSNQLSVKDATAQGSLATIATASGAQATAANQTTAHTKLDTIAGNQASQATADNQSTANGSLAAIESSLAGTLTVSAAAPARSSGQIASAASKTAGDLSSSVDGNIYRKCVIFGSCSDNSGSVKVHISHDDFNFYEDNAAHYYANYSNGYFAGSFDINAPYFKVEFMDTATYTLEYSMVD